MPATSVDTLIFELKVKDDASKTFDEWTKRLKDVEKDFEDFSNKIDIDFDMFGDPEDISKGLKKFFKEMENVDLDELAKSFDREFDQIADTVEEKSKNVGEGFLSGLKKGWGDLKGILNKYLVTPFMWAFNLVTDLAGKAFGIVKNVVTDAVKITTDFIKSSISTYMSFEDQLALVGKTTGMAGEELKAFGKEIIELAKPIGNLTAEDLLKVAEAAGQLGIANEDIAQFATSIGIGTIALDAFGGSTDKLALSIAKQQNVFGDTAKETDNYLSMLSKLSTSTAANELQISNFNLRMSKVASTMKITAQESSALGAVLISGGIQDASSAATLLSAAMVKMSTDMKGVGAASKIMEQDVARGGEGFKSLEEITGRSRESFASTAEMIQTAFGIDSVQSLLAISEAFGKIPESAEKTGLAVDAVGQQGLAVLSILADAANKPIEDLKSMDFILKTANESFAAANEHLAAYDRAMATTSNQLKLFGSMMDAIKLVIGEVFVEAIGRLMLKVNDFMTVFSDWIAKNETFKLILNDVVAGLEALANIALDAIISSFQTFIGYAETNGTTVWETIKTKALELWETLKSFFAEAMESASGLWDSLKEISLEDIISGFTLASDVLGTLASEVSPVIDAIKWLVDIIWQIGTALGTFVEKIDFIIRLGLAFEGWTKILEGIITLFEGRFLDGMKLIGDGVTDFIAIPFEALKDIIMGVFDWAVDYIKTKMSDIGKTIKDALTFGKGNSKEERPDLYEPIAGSAAAAAKAIDDITTATEAANAASLELENTTVGNSVYPDMVEWVGRTGEKIKGLSSLTKAAEATQAAFGVQAQRSLAGVGDQWDALNRKMTALQQTTTIADARRPQTEMAQAPTITRNQSAEASAPVSRTQGLAQPTSTVINISGVTAVDESSKERLVRMITSVQGGLGSRAVVAA